MTLGKIAYDAYLVECGGKSLVSGAPLPKFEEQSFQIQTAWEAAGRAVAEQCAQVCEERSRLQGYEQAEIACCQDAEAIREEASR